MHYVTITELANYLTTKKIKQRGMYLIELLKSKIHRATIADANLDNKDSVTISSEFALAAGLFEFQK